MLTFLPILTENIWINLGRLDEIFTRWTFRQVLLKNAYTLDEIQAMVAQTLFESCRIDVDGIGLPGTML